jgi:hypothetical protein
MASILLVNQSEAPKEGQSFAMQEPRTLQDLVRADLERAQRLVRKVHPDPIDPQFRIASPEGDWWIGITLTENAKERRRRLALVSDFMAWKLSSGFILASELHEPDAVLSFGLQHNDYYALISVIGRKPLSFSPPKLLKCENMDPVMLNLLPRGSRTITKARVKELVQWFGPEGKFPAVHIESGATGPI